MLEVNVVNKLSDNKVLISEKDRNVQNSSPRYYIANEDNADKFIKSRKNLNKIDGYQHIGTVALAACFGMLIGQKVKAGTVLKGLAGLVSGMGVYACTNKFDKMVDKQAQKNNLKHYGLEEITGDNEKVEAALNYKAEQEPEPEQEQEKAVETEE